jgi:hypothetical protein
LLAVPALAVPLLLCAVVASGPAYAKNANSNQTVNCRSVGGTLSSWTLGGCSAPPITGNTSTAITPAFPTRAQIDFEATITWNNARLGGRAGGSDGTTTIKVSVFAVTRNKCPTANTEWELAGTILGNTPAKPAVKGKVKIFACVSNSGALTNRLKKGNLRPAKL